MGTMVCGIQRWISVFAKYSAMGVKGFKIDFMDRDDQKWLRLFMPSQI